MGRPHGMAEAKRKRGRPVRHTKAVADHICARLASGETLRAICRDEDMPPESTVRQWYVDDRNGFAAQYARARDIGLDSMADEIIGISDDGSNDYVPTDEGPSLDRDHVTRSKLRVDSRKWYLSKLAPKRYGDKMAHELTGADGGPIEQRTTIDASGLSETALAELMEARRGGGS